MVTMINIPTEEYVSLIECRAKLSIIKNYVRGGKASYEDEKFLEVVLEEGAEDVRTD